MNFLLHLVLLTTNMAIIAMQKSAKVPALALSRTLYKYIKE